ncbi:lung adenoma susceptibility protein 2 isoform X2 [Melanotaenia boesemani]|uniref:lung adenoma susceptibility protein 2 isoform X2 n=1 Tax=Melanotaenia boesemani TaxID=1250792 RepID=UPI001C048193|nr:lung adenoma susceptibility protein 2 isoform X2 [Melanotaenia boesemani]
MEASSLVGDALSPESTVTSLLSSSGHLRSSLRPPERNTTFRYKDQEYESASEALDAYITDFERSSQSSGMLVLPHNRPSTTTRPTLETLRNKDVLRERLTDWELDFLNLPVSSLRHHGNRDRLSMTTDELLSIPYDGSMPVTHTSAFIQARPGLLSRSGPSSTRPAHRTSSARLCSSCAALHHVNHHHSVPAQTLRSCRCGRGATLTTFKPSGHRAARPSSALHLPRWLTSNKADMDCSEMGSVPDLTYPAWIQRCDVSDAPLPAASEPGCLLPGAPRVGAPSWLSDLENDDEPDQTPAQVDKHQSLRDLRLQLAEQISLLAAERQGSEVLATSFRDNRMEALIQKADQVLNWLSHSGGGSEGPADPVSRAPGSPVTTEDLLQRSPHPAPPFSPDSAALTEDQTNTEAEGGVCGPDSSWKQPGPVEAVKQMLFRLQAVEGELQKQQKETAALPPPDSPHTPEKQLADGEAEFQGFSGSPSLQRALHHLSRLKLLVEEPTERSREEEDEGRYSS